MQILFGPPEALSCMEDPARVLGGIQAWIAGVADMPQIHSSVLALWVMSTYFDAEDSNRDVAAMIAAVAPEERKKLLELLASIARRPVPGVQRNSFN